MPQKIQYELLSTSLTRLFLEYFLFYRFYHFISKWVEEVTMVKVFPVPVCPYANMQTLYPSNADLITGSISENTSSDSIIS